MNFYHLFFCCRKLGTGRSAYFRQIEEDAENHAAAILELKDAIGSFESRDMAELVRFHQHVEQQLVCLTDETQVPIVLSQNCFVLGEPFDMLASCAAGVGEVRGLPFQEAGIAEDGGRALLQAGWHRVEAQGLEAGCPPLESA
jgi:hypothetical protein